MLTAVSISALETARFLNAFLLYDAWECYGTIHLTKATDNTYLLGDIPDENKQFDGRRQPRHRDKMNSQVGEERRGGFHEIGSKFRLRGSRDAGAVWTNA